MTQKEVSEGLRRLAFGEIRDAVSLLFESEDDIIEKLPELDLFNISEIKRVKGGGMEIKFFDRLKALDKLGQVINTTDKSQAKSFYEALENSTGKAENAYEGNGYE
ncbi:MAG: terminase small subunit [Eubacterium sp.]|nr:terminase small subunit [Eubacterium sp.]